MKHLIQLAIAITLLLIQSMAFSQTTASETNTKKKDTIANMEIQKMETDTNKYKNFIGSYFLTEADITLTIIQEKNTFYLIAPGSKDVLTQKNDTTLYEGIRGVALQRVEGDENALKFTQNGYETTIKRVVSKEEK